MAGTHLDIFEVGVRDGLQNEKRPITTSDKFWFTQKLIQAGVRNLELGAMVRPDRVPQMADSEKLISLYRTLSESKFVNAWVLVPNLKGLERALKCGAKKIALFTAATESFAKKNIGMSISESLLEFKSVVEQAKKNGLSVRGYVSTAFGCPFEGRVQPKQALRVIQKISDLGVEQVSIGDTIGVATPKDIEAVLKPALKNLGHKRVAGHFHDTRGTALANALRSIDLGVRTLDASAGGLGGCPFAPGATGNLATEDLLYMLHGLGIKTGISLDKMAQASIEFHKKINRPLTSRYLQAFSSRKASS